MPRFRNVPRHQRNESETIDSPPQNRQGNNSVTSSEPNPDMNQSSAYLQVIRETPSNPISLPVVPPTTQPIIDADNNVNLKLVVDNIRGVLSCCACLNIESTLKQCVNGHIICQNCFLTIRQDERPQCPTCRVNLHQDTRRALIAQRILSELPEPCPDCNKMMLQKFVSSHRINDCLSRTVACGLAPLGCAWIGRADSYNKHYEICPIKTRFLENTVMEGLDDILHKIKGREQSINETFHCFKSSLRMLENHEIQLLDCTLLCTELSDTHIIYKSDQFHSNQSRWSLVIHLDLPTKTNTITDQATEVATRPQNMDSNHSENLPQSNRNTNRNNSRRHHPYMDASFSTRPAALRLPSDNQTNQNQHNSEVQIDQAGRPKEFGQISFKVTKENSPGVGRRTFAFMLLQLEVPSRAIKIYMRPQINSAHFTSRGEDSNLFNQSPLRWRNISSLDEMKDHNLIKVEFSIARKLFEEING